MVKIHVIIGSTRQNRFSEKPAQWIYEELKKREGVEAELVDLRDYPLPFYDEPGGGPTKLGGKYSNETAVRWAEKVGEADGYIIVTPEYNHGYPAVLKNALDYVYYEWNKKPVGFVSYGGVGGARSVEQLKQVTVELEMVPISKAIHIVSFWTLLDEEGNLKTETLEQNKQSFLDQLMWWTHALKDARERK